MNPTVIEYVRWRDALPDLSGLDGDDAWLAFTAAHERRCGFCRQPTDGHREPFLDHDHHTGLVRGWLCRGCNGTMISRVVSGSRVSRNVPHGVILYTQFPPAAACGFRLLYTSRFGSDPSPELENRIWRAEADGLSTGPSEEKWRRLEAAVESVLTLDDLDRLLDDPVSDKGHRRPVSDGLLPDLVTAYLEAGRSS